MKNAPHNLDQTFSERFSKMSDQQLVNAFNREVGNTGWVSARGIYLTALREEFARRNFDFIFGNSIHVYTLKYKIKLTGKTITQIG